MKTSFLFAAIAALLITASVDARCIVTGDTVNCFNEPFVVVSFPDASLATWYVKSYLSEPQRRYAYILTTNDQTRRALAVFPLIDGGATAPAVKGDRFVAEIFFTNTPAEVAELDKRFLGLTDDQKASAFKLPVATEFLGGGTLLIYRTFLSVCFAPDQLEASRASN